MGTCQFCVPWNAPLAMRPKTGPRGEALALTYDGWLWYRLHVQVHQTPAEWGGEIEQYTAELRRNAGPTFTE